MCCLFFGFSAFFLVHLSSFRAISIGTDVSRIVYLSYTPAATAATTHIRFLLALRVLCWTVCVISNVLLDEQQTSRILGRRFFCSCFLYVERYWCFGISIFLCSIRHWTLFDLFSETVTGCNFQRKTIRIAEVSGGIFWNIFIHHQSITSVEMWIKGY